MERIRLCARCSTAPSGRAGLLEALKAVAVELENVYKFPVFEERTAIVILIVIAVPSCSNTTDGDYDYE